jgi:hypothetical protein
MGPIDSSIELGFFFKKNIHDIKDLFKSIFKS